MTPNATSPEDHIRAFENEMREHGIDIDEPINPDGKLHRYHVRGDKPRRRNAWAVLHIDDRPAGKFGCNKRFGGQEFSWSSLKGSKPFTAEERRVWKQKMAADRAKHEAERQRDYDHGAERARTAIQACEPASDDHPYLQKKRVKSYGLFCGEYRRRKPGDHFDTLIPNTLVVPMRNACGEVRGAQAVFAAPVPWLSDENKDFLPGAQTKGLWFTIGTPTEHGGKPLICVAEGYSTAASIHACTGFCVVVAFYCGNLLPVGKEIRRLYPTATLVFCADDDRDIRPPKHPVENPGVTEAKKAASETGGIVAVPRFASLDPGSDSKAIKDWNDLHSREGADVVHSQIEAALTGKHDPSPATASAKPALDSEIIAAASPSHVKASGAANDNPIILDRANPVPSARMFVKTLYTVDGLQTLHRHRGAFYAYRGSYYAVADDEYIKAAIWTFLENAMRYGETKELVPFKPKRTDVEEIVSALRAVAAQDGALSPPMWLNGATDVPPAHELFAVANGLLHLQTGKLYPATPRFFGLSASDVVFDPNAPAPKTWLNFLNSILPGDPEAIRLLQEWFGYILTPNTAQQKILLIVGPKRSGKGTIARTLISLIGEESRASPTLASLSAQFGLEPLIGKPLALIADARLGGKSDAAAIAERLLSISGDDDQTIDRKHRSAWSGRLPTRFMMMTNELPRITDASGALASRFLIIQLTKSFYGNENTELSASIRAELPGILNWARAGYEELRMRGCFQQPTSGEECFESFEALASPVKAFIEDKCVTGEGKSELVDTVFEAWKRWSDDSGHRSAGTKQMFSRDLHAVLAGLKTSQRREDNRKRRFEGIALRT